MPDENIASQFAKFKVLVLDPIGAGPNQQRECKRAFYAGATAMFNLMLEASEPAQEEVCLLNMSMLSDEIDEWTKAIGTERE